MNFKIRPSDVQALTRYVALRNFSFSKSNRRWVEEGSVASGSRVGSDRDWRSRPKHRFLVRTETTPQVLGNRGGSLRSRCIQLRELRTCDGCPAFLGGPRLQDKPHGKGRRRCRDSRRFGLSSFTAIHL